MHFILTAIGSYGDVHPIVGLGAALAARHHRVSIVANPYFAEVVQSAGLELLSISTREEYLELTVHPDLWHPTKAPPLLFQRAIVDYLRPLYQLLEQNYVPGETVIGAHPLDASSRLLRENLGVPVATITLAPMAIWSDHLTPLVGFPTIGPHMPRWLNRLQFWIGNRFVIDPTLKRPINKFRRELGLPRSPRLFPDWWFTSNLNLCLFPDWFGPPQPDWPGPVVNAGFPLWDGGEAMQLEADVEQFLNAGDPPIVFTPGTANRAAQQFFATAVQVCERLERRGIFLTKFAEQLPAALPDTVRHFDFVPLTRLLPRSAAFVHHGGIGSSSQALAAGVPQLIRPLAFDQFDNAHRLKQLGVAEELRPKHFGAARVAGALERLTTSTEVAVSCKKWTARCDGAAAMEAACKALEHLAERLE